MTEAGVISMMVAAVGVIVWAVRIEGKVRAHESDLALLRKQADDYRLEMRAEFAIMRSDVQYIRQRIDAAMSRGA